MRFPPAASPHLWPAPAHLSLSACSAAALPNEHPQDWQRPERSLRGRGIETEHSGTKEFISDEQYILTDPHWDSFHSCNQYLWGWSELFFLTNVTALQAKVLTLHFLCFWHLADTYLKCMKALKGEIKTDWEKNSSLVAQLIWGDTHWRKKKKAVRSNVQTESCFFFLLLLGALVILTYECLVLKGWSIHHYFPE